MVGTYEDIIDSTPSPNGDICELAPALFHCLPGAQVSLMLSISIISLTWLPVFGKTIQMGLRGGVVRGGPTEYRDRDLLS